MPAVYLYIPSGLLHPTSLHTEQIPNEEKIVQCSLEAWPQNLHLPLNILWEPTFLSVDVLLS